MTTPRRLRPAPSRWRILLVVGGFLVVATLMIWSVYSLAVTPVEPVYHYVYAASPVAPPLVAVDEEPSRGRRFETVFSDKNVWKRYPNSPGVILYRTSARDWTNLLDLYDNFSHPRWRLPYRKPTTLAPSIPSS